MIEFSHHYAALPESFFERINPVPVKAPDLILFNETLAQNLGLDLSDLDSSQRACLFSGNLLSPTSQSIALAYAGHQFGYFVPQLGDGRAVLLGEISTSSGQRYDLQLKGSGRTRFSRQGDGRAALGPMLREYIVSEAMAALNIPTTRSLALVTTGERVFRDTPLPGAILTRVALSHIRIGSFEFFAAQGDVSALKILADYAIDQLYPQARYSKSPYETLLQLVIKRQALLIAQWMQVGFIHGVMNTDNTSLAGETLDYGPCAFMDNYHPTTVFSAIDRHGRYAYANQSIIAHWNLEKFGQCLLPLLSDRKEVAAQIMTEYVDSFLTLFKDDWLKGMCRKLGMTLQNPFKDLALVEQFLTLMTKHRADYTQSFRSLGQALKQGPQRTPLQALFSSSPSFNQWLISWQNRLQQEPTSVEEKVEQMNAVNPAFIPRNHRLEQVIMAAVNQNDYSQAKKLISVLSKPYDDQPDNIEYSMPPEPDERVTQTFCGT